MCEVVLYKLLFLIRMKDDEVLRTWIVTKTIEDIFILIAIVYVVFVLKNSSWWILFFCAFSFDMDLFGVLKERYKLPRGLK